MKSKTYPVFVREFLDTFPAELLPAERNEAMCCLRDAIEGEVTCYTDGPGGIYAGTAAHGVYHKFGKRNEWHALLAETCALPGNGIHAMQYDACGMLWIATDKGVCVYDGKDFWLSSQWMDTLPEGEVFSLCISPEGLCCFGMQDALVILREGQSHYLAAGRWLPGGKVTQLAVRGDTIYAGCEQGAAKLEIRRMTLEEKAAVYQATMERCHLREGYACGRQLERYGEMEPGVVSQSDNDGLWTGVYAASQALRFAATQDEAAREQARNSMLALLKLQQVTGIPGFPARSIRRPGAAQYGDGDPEWVPFQDEQGCAEWKRETSSDELVGHFFGLSYYFDLCADEGEKTLVAKALCAIADHILSHGCRLHDVDGLPTTWANWNPEDLNRNSQWIWERGINSAELLMMLRTAHHVSGKKNYLRVFDEFALGQHYLLNAARYKMDDDHDNHIDDKLGMFTMDTLLRYEDRPHIRAWLLEGLSHHWRYERVEQTPLWSLIASRHLGRSCDLDMALEGLANVPLDLIRYPLRNGSRRDLLWDARGKQLLRPLPLDEAPIDHFGHHRFQAEDGTGYEAVFGAVYLLPFWYGRYWGLC